MKNFDEKLLRLKQSCKLTADQDVAALLGMTKAAFHERKKRDSFPDEKLQALAGQRPDLGLDVTYILTGETVSDWDRDVLRRTAEVAERMEPSHDGPIGKKLMEAYKLTPAKQKARRDKYTALEVILDRCTDGDIKILTSLAMRLALKEIVK